jgi:hypothetical protein
VTFRVGGENRSGSSGAATLKGGDGGFTVTLAMKRSHNVICEKYRALNDFDAQLATVEEPLTDLVDGKSRTRVDTALWQYRTAGFSINVHSDEGGFPVVARGNIPAG